MGQTHINTMVQIWLCRQKMEIVKLYTARCEGTHESQLCTVTLFALECSKRHFALDCNIPNCLFGPFRLGVWLVKTLAHV